MPQIQDVSSAGTTLDDFLRERGIHDEVSEAVAKKVYAWQLEKAMKERTLSKAALARRMGTSRAQLERVLDPTNNAVSIGALMKAAASVGKRLEIRLVDE